MAATQSLPPPRFSFLTDGLLLPARNPGLFGPVLALTAAATALSHACLATLPLHDARDVILAGAVSLLTSITVGPIVWAITAVATCSASTSTDTPAFRQVLAKALDGGVTAGPVVTAVHAQIASAACQLGATALAFLADPLIRYTRSALLLDLLVVALLAAALARVCLGVVLSVAVAVSAAEPGCHRGAAVRRAWALTVDNADQAVVLVLANGVLAAVASPWRGTASWGTLDLGYLLVSSAARVLAVCAVTVCYYECTQRAQQGHPAQHLPVETGMEWLNSLPVRCRSRLQEILQGRCSIRRVLATLVSNLQRCSVWMLIFVSTHPWIAGVVVVCAGRLIVEGAPSIFYQNGLVSYRNYLRRKYHIYPRGCVDKRQQSFAVPFAHL